MKLIPLASSPEDLVIGEVNIHVRRIVEGGLTRIPLRMGGEGILQTMLGVVKDGRTK